MLNIILSLSKKDNKVVIDFNDDAKEFYYNNTDWFVDILNKCHNKFIYKSLDNKIMESIRHFWLQEFSLKKEKGCLDIVFEVICY